MDRPLTILIFTCLLTAAPAAAAHNLQYQRQGEWVTASAFVEARTPVVSRILNDVERYNEFLPTFMRTRPVRSDSRATRLSIQVDLPWPCRDIRATFERVDADAGILHWEYVEGNIDGGSMELSARQEGHGTNLSCLMHVQLPRWCPDWILGVMAKRVLRHVMEEIAAQAVAASQRVVTAMTVERAAIP
jgi:hypothetical protein